MSTNHKPAEGNGSMLVEQSSDKALPAALIIMCDDEAEESPVTECEIPPRADEFSDEELTGSGKKFQLVCMLKADRSPREALDHLEIKGSERWVRKLYKRYKEQGVGSLLDGRRRNGSNRKVLTGEVQDIILALWYSYPAAGPRA